MTSLPVALEVIVQCSQWHFWAHSNIFLLRGSRSRQHGEGGWKSRTEAGDPATLSKFLRNYIFNGKVVLGSKRGQHLTKTQKPKWHTIFKGHSNVTIISIPICNQRGKSNLVCYIYTEVPIQTSQEMEVRLNEEVFHLAQGVCKGGCILGEFCLSLRCLNTP